MSDVRQAQSTPSLQNTGRLHVDLHPRSNNNTPHHRHTHRSRPSTSSAILVLDVSTSSCLRDRSSRCSVNCRNWSSAFLLTCENFFIASWHCCNARWRSFTALPLYLSNAFEGSEPSSRICRCNSSRFCSRVVRLLCKWVHTVHIHCVDRLVSRLHFCCTVIR